MFMKEMEPSNKNELVHKDEMGTNWVLHCTWYADSLAVMVALCPRVVLAVVMDAVRVTLLGGSSITNSLLGVPTESHSLTYRLWFI